MRFISRVLPMGLLGLPMLAGCIEYDLVRVDSFAARDAGSFVYAAATNSVMTPNDDGASEQIRRDWLGETLAANNMCATGYVLDSRRLIVQANGPFADGGQVVYTGRCL
jgi:hypothetical protein